MRKPFSRMIAVVSVIACLCLSCSLLYPRARLAGGDAPGGGKTLRIIYPSAKMTTIATACTDDRCAVFFRILDYVTTSFPPPYGATLDERWLSYLGITDRQFNPLPGKLTRFDTNKRVAQKFAGSECALGAFGKGFVAVYLVGGDFYCTTFDGNGATLIKKRKIYGNDAYGGSANRLMSIGFHGGNIYLFLVEAPENMYAGSWSLNVVRYAFDGSETRVMRNFLPRGKDFYHSGIMRTHFRGNTLHIAWVDGTQAPGKHAGMYTLTPSFHFAACAVGDRQAAVTDIPLEGGRGAFTAADVAFIERGSGLALAIRDGDSFWTQQIDGRGGLAGRAERTGDPAVRALFDQGRAGSTNDVHITIGPE